MFEDFENHCWKDVVDPEVLEIYRPYRRQTYIGKKPAVLAIDLYRLAYEGGSRPVIEVVKEYPSSCGVYAWQALPPTQRLFRLAREKNLPFFHTTVETRKEVLPTQVKATNRPTEGIDPSSYSFKEEVAPQPGDVVIYKERASAFFGTPLIAHLTRLGVDSLIVCGQSTSGCVRASVVDAYSYGFHVVVAEECCFDRSLLSHKVSLFDMHHKYADVMTVDEIAAHLSRL